MNPPSPFSRSGAVSAAFTLIELLTVIAIIGILAAIILPTVGMVRRSARAAQCTSNLRQIGIAMNLYADEHKNKFPAGYPEENITWRWKLISYAGMPPKSMGLASDGLPAEAGIFVCPEFVRKPAAIPRATSYVLNNRMSPVMRSDLPWNYDRNFVVPSRTIAVVEFDLNTEWYPDPGNPSRGLALRHAGDSTHLLFVDAHVQRIKETPAATDKIWYNPQ